MRHVACAFSLFGTTMRRSLLVGLALAMAMAPLGEAAASGSDLFANRSNLGTAATVNTDGSNVGFTGEAGEPPQSGAITSAWWQWTAAANGTVTIDTFGSNFDTFLTVATGAAVNALTVLAQNDDAPSGSLQSEIVFDAIAGTAYQIAVDGFQSNTGNINLNINLVEAVAGNDLFANRSNLGTTATVNTNGSNVGFTGEVGEPPQSGAITSAWWQWTANANGTVTIDTFGSNFDTFLTVATGGAVNALTVLAQNDDAPGGGVQSEIVFDAIAGTTYQIAVDGLQSNTGNIALNINLEGVAGAPFSCANVSEIPTVECEALIALFNATDGPNWTNNSGWLETNTPCGWRGVTCFDGRLVTLILDTNQLSGSIPADLGNLSSLAILDLTDNQLSESIPVELGKLSNLRRLSLSINQLSGSIPVELGNLSNLVSLFLFSNQLSGSIPVELGNLSNLSNLNPALNQLSGSIPAELGNLSNLTHLLLFGNQLSGSIPVELGNLASLTTFALSRNQLSGSIPVELGNLSNLRALQLDQNQLNGSIPAELGNLPNLTFFNLSLNQLSGSIPAELGNLSSLGRLFLSFNQLSGPLPQNLTSLNLTQFNFRETGLCEPPDAGFQAWLASISNLQSTGVICNNDAGICGDLNGDAAVDVFDAIVTLQVIVGLIEPTPAQAELGDVVRDGGTNVFDAILLLQHIVGLTQITSCGPLT